MLDNAGSAINTNINYLSPDNQPDGQNDADSNHQIRSTSEPNLIEQLINMRSSTNHQNERPAQLWDRLQRRANNSGISSDLDGFRASAYANPRKLKKLTK